MIGILVILIISWFLLHFLTQDSIIVLCPPPYELRLRELTIGIIVAAVLCSIVQYLDAWQRSSSWMLAESYDFSTFAGSLWWDFRSVLTEELIFRGALLYILIKRCGTPKALWISAIAFGIYHWFSYGVFGQLVPMILVFIGTGIMGYGWALAFAKTKSIILPLGLHFGWNLCHNTFFGKGPLGTGILFSPAGKTLGDWASLINFLIGMVIAPIIIWLFVRYGVKSQKVESQ